MRRFIRSGMAALTCAAAVAASSGTAEAGTITGFGSVVAFPGGFSILAQALPATPVPNNDNTSAASANTLQHQLTFGGTGVFDLEYTVMNSLGTSEYFVDQTPPFGGVVNQSGVPWDGYFVELGFGTGRSFVRSNGFDFLDLDTPERDPSPTAAPFATVDHTDSNRLVWSNGLLAAAASGSFTFSLDVPDYSVNIPNGFEVRNAQGAIVGYRFTLRQGPTVAAPEPGMLALFGVGLAGIARRRFSNR
jgi:hypothetical protein